MAREDVVSVEAMLSLQVIGINLNVLLHCNSCASDRSGTRKCGETELMRLKRTQSLSAKRCQTPTARQRSCMLL